MIRTLSRLLLAVTLSTTAYPAQAIPIQYIAQLDGPSEAPPNASPGTGFARFSFDIATHEFSIFVEFSGLEGPVTVAHIHAPTAAAGAGTAGVVTVVPTFPGFPAGVMEGFYDRDFLTNEASFYNPVFIAAAGSVAAAEAAFAAALAEGKAYLNIHSQFYPGGEIRGFLAAVPEPGSLALLALGSCGLLLLRRRPTC